MITSVASFELVETLSNLCVCQFGTTLPLNWRLLQPTLIFSRCLNGGAVEEEGRFPAVREVLQLHGLDVTLTLAFNQIELPALLSHVHVVCLDQGCSSSGCCCSA